MAHKRGNGEGSVYFEPDRQKWCASVRLSNGRRGRFRFDTQREANRTLREVLQARDQGLPVPSDRLTLGQFLERWLRESIEPRRQPSTLLRYELDVRRHILPALGRVPLAKLTQHQVQVLLNQKLAAGLSPRSVQMIQGTLRTAINRAMKWDLVQRNVAELTDPIQVRRPKVRPFTPAQAQAFVAATEDDAHMALYRVALALGLRRGEVLALRWFDPNRPELGGADLEQGVVHVRQGLQRVRGQGLRFLDVKSDRSRRDLPLPAIAAEALRIHRDRQSFERQGAGPRGQEHGLVFRSAAGTPLDPDNVTHRFQRFLERADLPRQRFHDLRHACASLMVANGEPLLAIQEQLGHSQYLLTADTYSHLYDQMKRDAAARMNALLRGGQQAT